MSSSLYDQIPGGIAALAPPTRVMAIGAHPDDAEFGAGGTLFRWTTGGARATLVIATDGSMGSWDPSLDSAALVADRRREQDCAAAILGVGAVEWLGQPDGELQHTPALRKTIAALIKTHRPDIILTHDPWQRYQLHPDHRAAGMLAVDAVVAAREPRFYPDHKLEAHRPSALLLWSADEPDHAEPVDQTAFDAKVEALLCHASQSETTMGGASTSRDARSRFVDRIDGWLRDAGSACGVGRAETFKRLTP